MTVKPPFPLDLFVAPLFTVMTAFILMIGMVMGGKIEFNVAKYGASSGKSSTTLRLCADGTVKMKGKVIEEKELKKLVKNKRVLVEWEKGVALEDYAAFLMNIKRYGGIPVMSTGR